MSELDTAFTATSCEPTERDRPAADRLLRARRTLDDDSHKANRQAALRSSGSLFFTRCACGWNGLRAADPEVARREYDVHACRMTGEIGVRLRRTEALPSTWADETKQALAAVDVAEEQRVAAEAEIGEEIKQRAAAEESSYQQKVIRDDERVDDWVQRLQMLEMK